MTDFKKKTIKWKMIIPTVMIGPKTKKGLTNKWRNTGTKECSFHVSKYKLLYCSSDGCHMFFTAALYSNTLIIHREFVKWIEAKKESDMWNHTFKKKKENRSRAFALCAGIKPCTNGLHIFIQFITCLFSSSLYPNNKSYSKKSIL
jgi:hypothetical protein